MLAMTRELSESHTHADCPTFPVNVNNAWTVLFSWRICHCCLSQAGNRHIQHKTRVLGHLGWRRQHHESENAIAPCTHVPAVEKNELIGKTSLEMLARSCELSESHGHADSHIFPVIVNKSRTVVHCSLIAHRLVHYFENCDLNVRMNNAALKCTCSKS